MEEDIVTTTSEPSSEPASAPDLTLEPLPSVPDPASEPSEPVTVVSVDELIDRLVQSGQEEETTEGPSPEETEQLPEESDQTDAPVMEIDTGPMEIKGMDRLLTYAETIQQTLDHPALTTSFRDYTVTEGLLLLILLAAFAAACVRILKGGFQWLRW